MKDLIWILIGFIFGGALFAILLGEAWFSWRLWLVSSALVAIAYYLYCIAQHNRATVGQAITRAINELIKCIKEKQ